MVGASAFGINYVATSAPVNQTIPSNEHATTSVTKGLPPGPSTSSTDSTVASANGTSKIYHVKGFPGPVNGHHVGLETLLALMGSNGLALLKSANAGAINGSGGLIEADDVVLIKVNCQWPERGGTNTDLVRELVQTIVGHPEAFRGDRCRGQRSRERAIHMGEGKRRRYYTIHAKGCRLIQ